MRGLGEEKSREQGKTQTTMMIVVCVCVCVLVVGCRNYSSGFPGGNLGLSSRCGEVILSSSTAEELVWELTKCEDKIRGFR